MDKDRIKGSAEQAKGSLKEAAGKLTGDSRQKREERPIRLPERLRTH